MLMYLCHFPHLKERPHKPLSSILPPGPQATVWPGAHLTPNTIRLTGGTGAAGTVKTRSLSHPDNLHSKHNTAKSTPL